MEEKQLFGFSINDIDWETYIKKIHIPGLRKHVLKGRGSNMWIHSRKYAIFSSYMFSMSINLILILIQTIFSLDFTQITLVYNINISLFVNKILCCAKLLTLDEFVHAKNDQNRRVSWTWFIKNKRISPVLMRLISHGH